MPQSVSFELTYGCNLRCVHCLNPTHRVLPGELHKEEVFRILEEMAELGVLEISFTGGELFTHPDLFPILEKAHSLGFIITVLTNATRLTPEIIWKLEALNIRADVTIYGATESVYESVTQIPGSYKKFYSGLKLLSESTIPVILRMPMMTLNSMELDLAREIAAAMNFEFNYCFEIHPRQDGNLDPLQYRLSPEAKLLIAEQTGQTFSGYSPHSKSSCSGLDDFIECDCGRSKFSITPYGEMNLCTSFPVPKYDLRKGTIREGWEVLKRTVDEAAPNEKYQCPACELRDYCRQGRNDAWLETGNMSECLPHFHAVAGLAKQLHENHDFSRSPS